MYGERVYPKKELTQEQLAELGKCYFNHIKIMEKVDAAAELIDQAVYYIRDTLGMGYCEAREYFHDKYCEEEVTWFDEGSTVRLLMNDLIEKFNEENGNDPEEEEGAK